MVDPIKQYAPLDLTDQNKIINLGDPVDLQDAATKRYVDTADAALRALVPLTMGGDMLFMNPAGSAVVSSQPGPFSNTPSNAEVYQYKGIRVTGLTTGHTIRCNWESHWTSPDAPKEQWLRAFGPGGAAVLASIRGSDPVQTWAAYQLDLALTGGATEIQLFYTNPNRAEFRNLVYTDLDVASPDRLPIGAEGDVLQVASGLPAWGPGGGGGSGDLDGGTPLSTYGGVATLDAGGV